MNITRRHVLAAGAGLSLASLVNRYCHAQVGKRRLRLIVLNTEHSLSYQHHPEMAGTTAGPSYKYPSFLAPVLAETPDVRIVTGLYNTELDDQHGSYGASLTCLPPQSCSGDQCVAPLGGISIDQVIANALAAESPTKLKSLHLTTPHRLWSAQYLRTFSASGPGENLKPEASPELAYARVFGATAAPVTPGAPQLSDAQRRRSILDLVGADAARIQRLAPAGARPQIDQFMASVAAHQKRLEQLNGSPAMVSQSCMPLPTPTLKLPFPGYTNDRDGAYGMQGSWKYTEYSPYNLAQLDLIAMAMACDHTRVAYFDLGSDIYPEISINQNHHDFTHGNKYFGPDESNRDHGNIVGPSNLEGDAGKKAIDLRNAELIAHLVAQLKSFANGDGTTLLDDTLILWNNQAGGHHHYGYNEIPMLLIGGKNLGPAFTFVRFGDTGGRSATELNVEKPLPGARFMGDFYTTLASWYGVKMDGFGNPAQRKGMLPL